MKAQIRDNLNASSWVIEWWLDLGNVSRFWRNLLKKVWNKFLSVFGHPMHDVFGKGKPIIWWSQTSPPFSLLFLTLHGVSFRGASPNTELNIAQQGAQSSMLGTFFLQLSNILLPPMKQWKNLHNMNSSLSQHFIWHNKQKNEICEWATKEEIYKYLHIQIGYSLLSLLEARRWRCRLKRQ